MWGSFLLLLLHLGEAGSEVLGDEDHVQAGVCGMELNTGLFELLHHVQVHSSPGFGVEVQSSPGTKTRAP